ncbi:MAG: hypothetical protein JO281_14925 [Pseudonocardiales bacterium]|nr:hypothetical protein [Pseudonocardiales bacterium]
MSATSEPTTGIPNADKPGWWVVPPWPVRASLCDVVSHFLRFSPRDNASAAEKLTYYKGCQAAMEAAPRHELKYRCDWRWYEDLCGCIGRCVSIYQDKRAAEIQQVDCNVRSLQRAARVTHAAPISQERIS